MEKTCDCGKQAVYVFVGKSYCKQCYEPIYDKRCEAEEMDRRYPIED